MIMTRVWAMPNRWTFTIKPIAELIARYTSNGQGWVDPFAGMNSPAEITNDLNAEMPTKYHLDALAFLRQLNGNLFDGVLFDPPYSFYELRRCYKGIGKDNYKWGQLNDYWARCRDGIAKVIKPNGLCLSFGWNSIGIGKRRGFEIIEILLVCHGGTRNDTICTVERKIQPTMLTY